MAFCRSARSDVIPPLVPARVLAAPPPPPPRLGRRNVDGGDNDGPERLLLFSVDKRLLLNYNTHQRKQKDRTENEDKKEAIDRPWLLGGKDSALYWNI